MWERWNREDDDEPVDVTPREARPLFAYVLANQAEARTLARRYQELSWRYGFWAVVAFLGSWTPLGWWSWLLAGAFLARGLWLAEQARFQRFRASHLP